MPVIRRAALYMGIMIILLLLVSCKNQGPVNPVPDVSQAPELSEEYFEDAPAEVEIVEPEPLYEDTVDSITPDLSLHIMEKKRQNPDTVGWLYIPDTSIDAVILKNPLEIADNQFYLDVDFNRQPDKNGTFCTDFRNEFGSGNRDELSRITTIYGHSFSDDANGALFAQLKKYRDPEFARTHPYIFFSTESDNMVWEVFAVFHTTVDLPYITPDLRDNELLDMLGVVSALSEYNYASAVDVDDKLLTLSTCTFNVRGHDNLPEYNDYRFVVMAKLLSPEAVKKNEAVFSINNEAVFPDLVPMLMSAWKDYSFPVHISDE